MHAFFCELIPEAGKSVTLDSTEESHLFRTLRAKEGFRIRLMDGKGKLASAATEKGKSILIESVDIIPPPEVKVHLFISPPRKNKMDSVIRQCTEAGVWSITPLISERSVSIPSADGAQGRWKAIASEACKQSGNPFMPQFGSPVSFAEAAGEIGAKGFEAFYGTPQGKGEIPLPDTGSKELAWIVGPEGGFSDDEEALMQKSGFTPLRIGAWIMRTETAAVCGVCFLLQAMRRKTNASEQS